MGAVQNGMRSGAKYVITVNILVYDNLNINSICWRIEKTQNHFGVLSLRFNATRTFVTLTVPLMCLFCRICQMLTVVAYRARGAVTAPLAGNTSDSTAAAKLWKCVQCSIVAAHKGNLELKS